MVNDFREMEKDAKLIKLVIEAVMADAKYAPKNLQTLIVSAYDSADDILGRLAKLSAKE